MLSIIMLLSQKFGICFLEMWLFRIPLATNVANVEILLDTAD